MTGQMSFAGVGDAAGVQGQYGGKVECRGCVQLQMQAALPLPEFLPDISSNCGAASLQFWRIVCNV